MNISYIISINLFFQGRDRAQDLTSTSRHGQQPLPAGTKTKDALPVVLQSDFRKVTNPGF